MVKKYHTIDAPLGDKAVMYEMLQKYLCELSLYQEIECHDGVYSYPYFDLYWVEESRFPYIYKLDGEIAGFALVRNEGEFFSMAEFYLREEYRGDGHAERFAASLVQQHIGSWRIDYTNNNLRAKRFWNRVVANFSDHEIRPIDDLWEQALFNSK